MATRKFLVVYHRVDYDGLFSALIAKSYLKSKGITVETLGWNYGDELPNLDKLIRYNSGIVLTDISFPANAMKTLKESAKATWIDHHVTAIQDSEEHGYSDMPGLRKNGVAACELTWKYYWKDKPIPQIVQMAGAYDVWDKNRFDWSEVVALQYGLKDLYGHNLGKLDTHWEDLCEDSEWLQDRGEVIYGWLQKQSEGWVTRCGFPVKVAGRFSGIAIITPLAGSLVFESVLEKYDLFLVLQINDGGTKYNVSLYTEPSKNLDFSCGEYMKQFGGGGHKTAAGCNNIGEEMFKKIIFDHEF